jgi:hypothetical protein
MTSTTMTLLDEVLPEFDFGSRHARRIDAQPERVAEAIDGFRLGGGASLLVKMRGLHLPSGSIRDVLMGSGFTVLAERPGVETVAGTNGRFWALRELTYMEAPRDLRDFQSFHRPGWAQAAISFRIEPLEDGSTHLITETRVRCVDDAARRRFVVYWSFIKVFSGWLRRDFLRKVARTAEGAE